MKKSTGIVFLFAAALAAFVYFYDMKHNPPSETPADTSKPAYSVASTDITGMQIDRAGTTTVFDHHPDGWYITKPVATKADAPTLDAITGELPSVRVDRTFPATPDNLKSFGLNDPTVTLSFTMKNGAQHKLQLGARDFTGSSVYAIVDGAKDISLMSDTILTSTDKNLDDFRDHTVLPGAVTDAKSFDLINPSGEVSAVKMDDAWKIEKPRAADADSNAILTLLGAIGSGQISHFVADTDKDLGKYGLAKPDIIFRSKLPSGAPVELQVGKKEGDEYDARDVSRPIVFRITETIHKNLMDTFLDLRDKAITHLSDTDITHAELHNPSGVATCTQSSGGTLMIDQPAGSKSAPAECGPFVFDVESTRATQIFDTPPADIAAKLAKPAARVILTPKSGPKQELHFSAVSGDSIYAQVVGSPTIYKLDKKIADDLTAKPPGAIAK